MGVKGGFLLLGLAAAVSVGVSFWAGAWVAAWLLGLAAWVKGLGPGGWVLFVGVEFCLTLVGVVPGALLGIAAGAVFGVAAGFCASAVGIFAGAVVAFWLSRSAVRPWIGRVLARYGWLAVLDEMIVKDGWRLVALLRVSPVMPFSITSYALGFSGISARDYALGTCASLPPLLGYVVIGALGGMAARRGARVHVLLLAVGVGATVILSWHLTRLMRRALRTA